MKEKFIQFLKDNNCLEQFEENLKSNPMDDPFLNIDVLFSTYDPKTVIGEAFYWHETPEGFDFWEGMYEKWYNA